MHDMHESGPSQSEIIARFLHHARIHFGLDTPEKPFVEQTPQERPAPRRGNARQQLLRSLLIAGGIGSLCSGASFAATADPAGDEVRLDREVAETAPAAMAFRQYRRDGGN